MTIRIPILFLENDIGKADLTPTIKITRDSDHVAVVDEVEVTDKNPEIAGYYGFLFTTALGHDTAQSFSVRVNSVVLTGDEQFAWATIPAYEGEYDVAIAAVQATAQEIKAKTDTIVWDDVTFIKDCEGGNWEIDKVAKQMVFYKAGTTTEVARFNLFDEDGASAYEDVFKRERA